MTTFPQLSRVAQKNHRGGRRSEKMRESRRAESYTWGVALSMGGNLLMRVRGFTMKLLDVFTTETFVAMEPLVDIFVNPDSSLSVPSSHKHRKE